MRVSSAQWHFVTLTLVSVIDIVTALSLVQDGKQENNKNDVNAFSETEQQKSLLLASNVPQHSMNENELNNGTTSNAFSVAMAFVVDVTLVAASLFIVFGGVIPFLFQYLEIKQRQSARGFSLFVCLTQLLAHTLRIFFWFGRHFELQLLAQSVIMISAMWLLITVAVNTSRKHILPPYKGVSVWSGHMLSHFWAWTDISSYLFIYALFTCITAIATASLLEWSLFVEALVLSSSSFVITKVLNALFIEANLGTPQALRNYKRKSTTGMSVRMVLCWTLGDVGKTIYFFVRHTPAQFYICGIIQIFIDLLILSQVVFYKDEGSDE